MTAALGALAPDQGNAALARDGSELAWLPRLGPFRVRPLHAAEREAVGAFGAKLDPDDLRLRFAGPIRLDGAVFDAQFRGIDHDRVEAFAAINADGEILGVGHIVRTAADAAELALLVRSDLKRRGLGRLLLDRLVRHAQALGLAELCGQILYENRPMLRLADEAGVRLVGGNGVMAELCKDLRSLPCTIGMPRDALGSR